MARGSSVISDNRYYSIPRSEQGKRETRVGIDSCDSVLQAAPTPSTNLRTSGRRPHLHGDREKVYVGERISLNPRIRYETGPMAVLAPKGLANLAAYPAEPFAYERQNRNGDVRGGGPGSDPGYSRIVTDTRKNQVGMSYHPLGNRKDIARAEVKGAFIADYRRDSVEAATKHEQPVTTYGRNSTWPRD